jgi:hypothetical protein
MLRNMVLTHIHSFELLVLPSKVTEYPQTMLSKLVIGNHQAIDLLSTLNITQEEVEIFVGQTHLHKLYELDAGVPLQHL